MAHHILDNQDFEGHGIYSAMGAELPTIPSIPSPTAAIEQLLGTVTVKDASGLRLVKDGNKPQVLQLLATQKFLTDSAGDGTLRGRIVVPNQFDPAVGTPEPNWPSTLVKEGFVLMVHLFGSTLLGIATSDPAVVAAERGSYVIIDGPASVIAATRALLSPGTPSCPAGSVFSTAQKRCVAVPRTEPGSGGGGSLTDSITAAKGLPSWVLPVAGVVVVGGGIMLIARAMSKKRVAPAAVTPNFRRW